MDELDGLKRKALKLEKELAEKKKELADDEMVLKLVRQRIAALESMKVNQQQQRQQNPQLLQSSSSTSTAGQQQAAK